MLSQFRKEDKSIPESLIITTSSVALKTFPTGTHTEPAKFRQKTAAGAPNFFLERRRRYPANGFQFKKNIIL